MMEEPDMDWSINEECSYEESRCGMMSWILSIGKKILVTSFAITSAPVIAPPLAVISAVGFAFSVPSWFFLASYACTNKIMSKFLPISPTHNFMIEYGSVSNYIGEDEEDNMDVWNDMSMIEEEQEQMEDIRNGIEMRVELDDQEEIDRGEPFQYVDELVEQNRYEEDVGEYLEEEEDRSITKESNEGGPFDDMHKVEVLVRKYEEIGYNEGKQMIEVNIKAPKEEEYRKPIMSENKDQELVDMGISEAPFEVTTITLEERYDLERVRGITEEEELWNETTGLIEKIRDEGMVDDIMTRAKENEYEREFQRSFKDEGLGKIETPVQGEIGIIEVVLEKPMPMREGKMKKITQEKKEHVIGGSSISKDKEKIGQNGRVSKQPYESGVETIDLLSSLPVSIRKDESKLDAGISSEILYNEKKIWEKIDAIRAIIGYKGTPNSTCMGELKALYVFTGLDASSSFNHHPSDPHDLAQLNQKLKSLMAIVGVK